MNATDQLGICIWFDKYCTLKDHSAKINKWIAKETVLCSECF